MRLSLISISISFLTACSSSFVPGEGDDLDAGPPSFDGAPPSRFDAGRDGSPAFDGAPPDDRGIAPVEPPRRPDGTVIVRCGAATCPAGFECCHTTTECHDPAVADSCPRPGPIPGALRPCGSNAHCGPGEYCRGGCGAGDCAPRPTREDCDRNTGWIEVCACDGNTYADECVAASAGIASGARGRCGGPRDDLGVYLCDPANPLCPPRFTCQPSPAAPEGFECVQDTPAINCTFDGHCPAGTVCCEAVSLCVSPAADAYCDPTSGRWNPPCVADSDCFDWAATERPGLFDYSDVFCAGDGCEGGGFCRFRSEESCTGVLDPVCGCNGMTYQNECEAFQEGQRIAARRGC